RRRTPLGAVPHVLQSARGGIIAMRRFARRARAVRRAAQGTAAVQPQRGHFARRAGAPDPSGARARARGAGRQRARAHGGVVAIAGVHRARVGSELPPLRAGEAARLRAAQGAVRSGCADPERVVGPRPRPRAPRQHRSAPRERRVPLRAGGGAVSWSRVQAVIFDVDGVLLDARASYHAVAEEAARRAVSEVVGEPCTASFDRDREVPRFKAAGNFNDDWEMARGIALLADPALLERVAAHFPVALYTGRNPGEAALALLRCELHVPQRLCWVADGRPRKPDPAGLLWLCNELVRPGGEVLFIGDTADDRTAAEAARARGAALVYAHVAGPGETTRALSRLLAETG